MNSHHSITFLLVVAYLLIHGLYSVYVNGQDLQVFKARIRHSSVLKLLKYKGYLRACRLFAARSLILSIGFISLVLIYTYQP
jgi:hypothetical protein